MLNLGRNLLFHSLAVVAHEGNQKYYAASIVMSEPGLTHYRCYGSILNSVERRLRPVNKLIWNLYWVDKFLLKMVQKNTTHPDQMKADQDH